MRLVLAIGIASSIGLGALFAAGVPVSAENFGAGINAGSTKVAPAPPGRVGRVSLVSGKAGFRGPGEMAWSDAEINDPVARGVALRTDPYARAELRIGSDTIELAGATEIAIADLREQVVEIVLRRGRIGLGVGRVGDGKTVEVDIPGGEVWPLRPGQYDIAAGDGEAPSRVAAFAGRAQFFGGGSEVTADRGTAIVLGGPGGPGVTGEVAAADPFSQWCRGRAVDEARLAAAWFVSPAVSGLAALDGAGKWKAAAGYGEVWVPGALPAGWAPYRDGHWRWVAPWGWTWIDDAAWGFAPSHYGRWAFVDQHWVWVPGGYAAHPVWAPAVVAFLGTPGVGLSFAEGTGPAVAWFPLAPGEVYWPSYTGDLDYIRQLNRPDIADPAIIRLRADGEPPAAITNGAYANRIFASVVPRPVFVAGQAVAAALLQLPSERLRNAPALMGSPQIGPPTAAAVRVAAAATVQIHPAVRAPDLSPSAHVAAHAWPSTEWAQEVRAAFIRSRLYQREVRMRSAALRVPAYAGRSRLRYTIVLRVARAGPVRRPGETRRVGIRRKVIRR